jgi:transcriptional regulator with XRE-family HTH domain/predicted negative regulator of RcsB-dependent stress response
MDDEGLPQHPLTHLRHRHGWSMEDLARRLTLAARCRGMICRPGRDRIYKWESSRATPGEDYQMLLADVLHVPDAVRARHAWPWWLPAFDTPHPFTARGSRAALTEALVTLEHPDRRAFLAFTTAALAGVAANWAGTEPGRLTGALNGRRVDAALLAWLDDRMKELRALTNTAAPECADLVHVLLKTTVRLINDAAYDEATGRRLHQIAAAAAQCAGWLHFDQGHHHQALRHWNTALHAAHSAHDRDQGAGILSDIAYSATWQGHPDTAVRVLQHARSRTHSATARSLLDLRRARALAALGDTRATEHALASAESELGRAHPATAPAWVSWMSPADLSIDAGRCWLDLDRPHQAANALAEGLTVLDPARSRTRSVALAYRAESALARHDVPAAAHDARAALDTAQATGATRCIGLARTTLHLLAPHRTHPDIDALYTHTAQH